ncbi:MAG TPA: tyrosine-type recombinase/integrase, partial [Thermodesulfovibrionales bacterium]|nr:tyrosine-type recombinase/integrase [Thermodesulfovibrionales bacterium]
IDDSLRLYEATRHSFASNLVNAGSTIYKVSKLLGHSSVKMTEKYAHSEVEHLRTDIQKLSLNRHQTVISGVVHVQK